MIVSHKLRFVYVGPPKTGSTTLHSWLMQPALADLESLPHLNASIGRGDGSPYDVDTESKVRCHFHEGFARFGFQ